MSLDPIIDTLPDYAKDLKLNYSSLVRNNTELTPQQLWGTVIATSIATRNAALTAAAFAEGAKQLTPVALEAAKSCGRHHGDEQHLLPLPPPQLQ